MQRSLKLILVTASLFAGTPVVAQEADEPFPWMKNCKSLTMAKGADDETAHGYCACIDHEMGDDEINDIPGWEKSNPAKVAACRKAAE